MCAVFVFKNTSFVVVKRCLLSVKGDFYNPTATVKPWQRENAILRLNI